MGLFNRLGREVEKFTQDARTAAQGGNEYECEACGERFYASRDRCSECSSPDVVRVGTVERHAEPDESNEPVESNDPGESSRSRDR